MTILEELLVFIKSILSWIYALIGFFIFFLMFGVKKFVLADVTYTIPWPGVNSFSVQVFNMIRGDLLPPGVQLVTTNPMSAFVSQVILSLLLSLLVTTPFFLFKLIIYLRPALLPREKRAILWTLPPIIILFFSGSLFSYFFLIPKTFEVLYPYATAIGAVPFFSIDEFIYYVFSLTASVGVMFLMPVFMVLLSYIGIIEAQFWLTKWRYACLLFLIFSAIITPDGTGVTMILLFVPLMGLYFLGYIFAARLDR